jgi:hypothetical protein
MSNGLEPRQYLRDPLDGRCGYCGRPSWLRLLSCHWAGTWSTSGGDSRNYIVALYQCGGCERASALTFREYGLPGERGALLIEQAPEMRAIPMELLPHEVQEDRLEAWNDFYAGQFRSAVIMARTTLQRAVRTVDPFRGGNLNQELDNLVTNGIITAQIRANVDEVRLSGNDVAHPETLGTITEEEARESLLFLDDFLGTVIVLPERQRRRQQQRTNPTLP